MAESPRQRPSGKRLLTLLLAVILAVAGWQVVRQLLGDQEREIRTQVRESFERHYPEQAAQAAATYGLRRYRSAAGTVHEPNQVVLVHGLDEPGKVWMNLAPRLVAAGLEVWIMSYPNDQPIVDSARFFREELQRIVALGITAVDIVAHSMGGLVCREMLTNPQRDCARSDCGEGPIPRVRRVVMVGTPNHGSELARFRWLAELRDQAVRLVDGEFDWLGGIFDGAGEAGMDLTPGSRFLQELNRRPPPSAVEMTVIAGVMGQDEQGKLRELIDGLGPEMSEGARRRLNGLGDALQTLTHGLGDGLVTVESARLPGASLLTVPGNHLSIIRNLDPRSDRVPPAVPIILERLGAS